MFRSTGLTWKDLPIWGRAVAMIVPSRFSMKKAPATGMAMSDDLRMRSGILSETLLGSVALLNIYCCELGNLKDAFQNPIDRNAAQSV